MALGPHQIAYLDSNKVKIAEAKINQQLSDAGWVALTVQKDGAKRNYWTIRVNGSFSEMECEAIRDKYLASGWGYVTVRDHTVEGFSFELCEKEVK